MMCLPECAQRGKGPAGSHIDRVAIIRSDHRDQGEYEDGHLNESVQVPQDLANSVKDSGHLHSRLFSFLSAWSLACRGGLLYL